LKEHGEIQLSGLGQAISSVVTLTEILKNKNLAVEKSIATAVENLEDKDTGK
jgi:DNA-binding protein